MTGGNGHGAQGRVRGYWVKDRGVGECVST